MLGVRNNLVFYLLWRIGKGCVCTRHRRHLMRNSRSRFIIMFKANWTTPASTTWARWATKPTVTIEIIWIFTLFFTTRKLSLELNFIKVPKVINGDDSVKSKKIEKFPYQSRFIWFIRYIVVLCYLNKIAFHKGFWWCIRT